MGFNPNQIMVFAGDGHGENVQGKRTPTFSNGTVIKENEFNTPTKLILFEELKRQGVNYYDVSPELSDTALTTRTTRANNVYSKNAYKAYCYISIHYNAMSDEWDDTVGGLETYHYYNSVEGKKLATEIHSQLIKGTSMKNRGVKEAGFYVLKHTAMTACLVECGFMSNHTEALLMKNIAYQTECAVEICKGVCNYYGLTYKEATNSDLENYTRIISPVYYKIWLDHFEKNSSLNWEGFLASALSK